MAVTRDDFQNVPSSGIIPDDLVPADAFAVSYTFLYFGNVDITNFNHSFVARVKIYFYNDADDVIYVVEIEEHYNLFIIPLAPGLAIYTWNWVPQQEEIKGRKGEDEDAEPMTTLGLGSFGVEPAEGTGTTSGEVIVDSTFYSYLFTETLESGDKLKIKFHNVSAGYVVSRASLQIATEGGVSTIGAAHDTYGALLQAVPSSSGAFFAQSYGVAPQFWGVVFGARNPSVFTDNFGRVWQLVKESGGWFFHVSYDGGRSFYYEGVFESLMGVASQAEPALVWSKEVGIARPYFSPEGERVSCALDGKTVYFKFHNDDGDVTVYVGELARKQDVAPLKRNVKWEIIGEDGVLFTSVDGANWTPRGTTADAIVGEDSMVPV
jgi:hypothetical protein